MVCTVVKKFRADGQELLPGERVDSTQWRNEQTLIATRYLQPAPLAAAAARSVEDAFAAPKPGKEKKLDY
mgnify:CR=1 FL=1